MNRKNPFIAGSWVRGENFFGRDELISRILEGRRNHYWVAGTRRVGKTSLLKQIELVTNQGALSNQFISLFWDLQGSHNLDGLRESLLESVEDAEERFAQIGVEIDRLEATDLFGGLRTLRKKAREHRLNLLLLCDEAEELITVERNNPDVLPKLRRFFQSGENLFTVLVATRRLAKLETTSLPDTSPFLYGFIPPIYLTSLEEDTARRLVERGGFSDEQVTAILQKTDGHPYLMQLICERLFDSTDLDKVVAEMTADEMVCHFFSLDFQYLEERQKEILMYALQGENLSLDDFAAKLETHSDTLIRLLYELIQLGFLRQVDSHYRISNYFFEKWLQREKEELFSESALQRAQKSGHQDTPKPQAATFSPDIGAQLDQHELLDKLGAGGMGVVFKARDTRLNRIVAVKILHPHLLGDSEFTKRFLLEAQAASALNHPNITTIYQIGTDAGMHYISMEYVQGQKLSVWRAQPQITLADRVRLAIQVGQAIAHAHSKQVIHRDLKSDNILVTDEDIVKVMDFGLAKIQNRSDKGLTKSGTTLGTLAYMSPEQASGLPTDHRTDIFSFGVVLYELFTGELPFDAEYELSILYALLNEEPKPLGELHPQVSSQLEAVVMRALRKDRDARYQTMDELLEQLDNAATRI